MTTEAPVLVTPAIRFNSFVGKQDMGNFVELEEKYGLINNYKDAKLAMEKAVELVKREDLKETWDEKRQTLLREKKDFTAVIVQLVLG